ncbi:MAG TPA: phosphotransferase family protein [Acidimicrobiales bacterium]|jgi:aminoglycoside phosphotransferase (APT) family kinase protein
MAQVDLPAQLGAALAPVLGAGVVVDDLARAPGGASRETWTFTARASDGTRHRYVLRRDPAGSPPSGLRLEGALLLAAHRAGVPVPEIAVVGDDDAALGAGSLIMQFIEGETIPRRILRDESLAAARAELAAQCGRVLAAIHRIPPFEVAGLPGGDPVEQLRAIVDRLGQPHPAFELAFRWLGDNRPPRSAQTVVHGDFRNGNLIVGPDGIRAVLDWELAHLGDPLEDLGWLCVKAWRFGSELPVGGFGPVDQLVLAYEAAADTTVDRAALRWWEVLGTLRWGVICIVQTATHLTGTLRSVELAAIGRRVCEVEWDLLELLGAEIPAAAAGAEDGTADGAVDALDGVADHDALPPTLHDAPSAAELLEAVGEFLTGDVMAGTDGRLRFHARVAANVVAMVGRELTLGPRQASAHAARLTGLGVADEAELATAIRTGRLAARVEEVYAVVRATVAEKLAVAHPGYRQ